MPSHRRIAIGGWLAFVVLAFVAGGAIGQRNLTVAQMGSGESGRALRAYAAADYPKASQEQVLVQARHGAPATDPARQGRGRATSSRACARRRTCATCGRPARPASRATGAQCS